MSDSTISQLPSALSVSGADYIPIDQGGVTKKATLAQIGNGTVIIASGKTLYVSNTLTLAGTDGVTVIFPSTNATLARTDAAQTFTGVQTFTSTIVGGITGNAGTATLAAAATVLATPRGINGVNFDGSAAITVPVNNADDATTNATVYPLWTATVGGNYAAKVSSTQLTFNPSSGILTATGFAGPLTGNVTGNVSGSSGSTTGNAATATALQTARTIDGTSFDGTANILVVAPAIHAATNKTTPVDADEFAIWDSVSGLLNHVTWANIKATLKTYFDTIYAALAGSATQTFSVATPTSAAHAVRLDFFAPITASLGADVALNNTANYFDGPTVAQGSTGVWFASGTVTCRDTSAAGFGVKLWDGTTIAASAIHFNAANANTTIAISGYFNSPAGNIRISVRDFDNTSGKIIFNATGNSKDSTITAFRIG